MLSVIDQTGRALRSAAYDVVCRRDGLSGWRSHRQAFLDSTKLDPASLGAAVDAALRRVVAHAHESSPYYRRIFDRAGVRPAQWDRGRDFPLLPFLTKDLLREHKSAMISERFRVEDLLQSYTGGTTGAQTAFYLDRGCRNARHGRQWGMLELCGYSPGTRRALVWGVDDDLMPVGQRDGFKQWFRRFASSQEVLNCSHIDPQTMRTYHDRLLRFRPSVMYGYPSALMELGQFIDEQSLERIAVRRIITTAERLSPLYRRTLRDMFQAEVFDLYATRDYGCIGFECGQHQGFHIDVGNVFVEIVDDGRAVAPGETGEIVVTDLLNYGMPMIRSRSGDLGSLAPERCPCGSPLPLLQGLDGRESDVVFRADGTMVPGLILTDFCADIESIRLVQFVQKTLERIDVLVVATDKFTDQARAEISRHVRQVMGERTAVHVERVEELDRNPRSGKLREILCTIDRGRPAAPRTARQ